MLTWHLATHSDIPELVALINSAYRGESSYKGWTTEAHLLDGVRVTPEILRPMIDPPKFEIGMLRNSERVLEACVHLKETPRGLYVGLLSVKPELQARGHGRALLQHAEDIAREKNLDRVWMTVINVRTELIDWYVRRGYRATGEREDFPERQLKDATPKVPLEELEFVVLEKKI